MKEKKSHLFTQLIFIYSTNYTFIMDVNESKIVYVQRVHVILVGIQFLYNVYMWNVVGVVSFCEVFQFIYSHKKCRHTYTGAKI